MSCQLYNLYLITSTKSAEGKEKEKKVALSMQGRTLLSVIPEVLNDESLLFFMLHTHVSVACYQ